MHRRSTTNNLIDGEATLSSYWSPEDDAFLAEVEGIPGTLAEGRTEREARNAAMELAETWRRVEERQEQLTLEEIVTWMGLDQHAAERIRASESVSHQPPRRSLSAWSKVLSDLEQR